MNPAATKAFGQALAGQIRAAGAALSAETKAFGTALSSAVRGFGAMLSAEIKAFGAATASVIRSIGSALAGTVRAMGGLARGVGSGVGQAARGVGAGAASVIRSLRGRGGSGSASQAKGFREELSTCTQSLKRFGQAMLGLALASTITGFNQFRQAVEYATSAFANALAPVLFSVTAGLVALADVASNVVGNALKLMAGGIIGGLLGAIAAFVKGVQRFIVWFADMQMQFAIVFGEMLRKYSLITGVSQDQANAMYAAAHKLREFLTWNVAAELQDFDQRLMDAAGAVAKDMRLDLSKNSGANVGFGSIADAWKRMQEQTFQTNIQARQLAAQEKIVRMIEGAVNAMNGKGVAPPAFVR